MNSMKLNRLRGLLEHISQLDKPDPALEQYFTPPDIAAGILYNAAMCGDIEGRKVADLGCGSGVFSIGACLLGAESVTGIDVGQNAVSKAKENAERLLSREQLMRVSFHRLNVLEFEGTYDTVFQNPPFGSQTRNADIPFLRKALEIGTTVYTMHLRSTDRFIRQKIGEFGGRIEAASEITYRMPRTFPFHTHDRQMFRLILYKAVNINKLRDR